MRNIARKLWTNNLAVLAFTTAAFFLYVLAVYKPDPFPISVAYFVGFAINIALAFVKPARITLAASVVVVLILGFTIPYYLYDTSITFLIAKLVFFGLNIVALVYGLGSTHLSEPVRQLTPLASTSTRPAGHTT